MRLKTTSRHHRMTAFRPWPVLVIAMPLLITACGSSGGSAVRADTTREACSLAKNMSPIPASTGNATIAFSWPASFIIALQHSGETSLKGLGNQLINAARRDSGTSANAALSQVKIACQRLFP